MNVPTKRLEMTLEDRLSQNEGWVYMTGMQALVRLPIQQRKRDALAGLNTGGYISGYRGSPLGTYDMNLWKAKAELDSYNIVFQSGVNEDLAATATWGSQMVGTFPGARVEGVFSIWYGKSPGVDRSMDPIRHANLAGTSAKGGSIMLIGDDHGAKSSSVACYSDFNFVSAGAPLLAPANPQEVLDFGLHGIAMSRHASVVVGLKLVTDVIEGGGSVYVSPNSPEITMPKEDGSRINPALYRPVLEQEQSLYDLRLKRVLDYARINGLNQITGSKSAKIGIVSAGKASQDLAQALQSMHYKDGKIGNADVKVLKVGLVWPLDDQILKQFAKGLDTIIVVEEKRPLLEDQIRATLYGSNMAPRIIGKTFSGQVYAADAGECAFPNFGEIDPTMVSRVIARAVNETDPNCGIPLPNQPDTPPALGAGGVIRPPSFCAGCPHGRSTQVIEGSRALAGIGCHTMAVLRNPRTTNSISQMGGEGMLWLGQSPFTDENHVFANMGDGTYFHSGLLAIRAAIAANVNITYKLLHNGFVSMTGGQPHDGEISPEMMIEQVRAEGVERIALVADEPEKYEGKALGTGVTLHPRSELDVAQKALRDVPGVTVLIFDQPCATERRRLRKRGKWADPDKRVFINPAVCEGCGDCSTVSGCMAIEPLETEFGRKRVINQSSCNKDFSCVEGFCPSFVTVEGATLRKNQTANTEIDTGNLPMPNVPKIDGAWAILVSGIGGAGVVTVGQTLAVAAHADGYFSSNLDITGLAQKYGAVHSHIKIAESPDLMRATRIASGEANTMIGCDLVVAAGDEALSKLNTDDAFAVVDSTVVPTAEFSMNPDWQLNGSEQLERVTRLLGDRARQLDAQNLAEKVMGDRVFANMLLIGASWQQGGIPLSLEAIHRAIELNGVAVEANKRAFALGRLVIADPSSIETILGTNAPANLADHRALTLDEVVSHRASHLTSYDSVALADRYRTMIAKVKSAGLSDAAVMAVAHSYSKLLSPKDEWEVARLYSKPEFRNQLGNVFEGDLKLTFYFGAWPFGGMDSKTGKPVKGPVSGKTALRFFGWMNRLRALRGSIFDPFRNSEEAKLGRRLLAEYEADIAFALDNNHPHKAARITELLDLPEHIRGYGHVRERTAKAAAQKREELRSAITAKEADAA